MSVVVLIVLITSPDKSDIVLPVNKGVKLRTVYISQI